ncbi:glycoside hydrolase family 9 protein [Deinococcus aestuarii]|uniref:glycoside hydrolase family 9 protein n=1 Tax=Deinococcus aestuarii TaxID=2774531 RepID=UPI001C0E88DC|nr:glycoside hydrolase family 9 protein [Deinococcus aestuarii]
MSDQVPRHLALLLAALAFTSCRAVTQQGRSGEMTSSPGAPVVSLKSSAPNVSVGGSFTLTATARAVTRVVFYDRGRKLGEDRTAPYSLTVRATPVLSGEHTYTAQAFDRAGRSGLSGPVPVEIGVDNLLDNGGFRNGRTSWWVAGGPGVSVQDGEACLNIGRPGANEWDVILGQSGLGLMRDARYTVSFTARADAPTAFKVMLQKNETPYPTYFNEQVGRVTKERRTHHFTFDMTGANDAQASLQFKLGAQKATRLCLGNVVVRGPRFGPGPVAAPVDDRAAVRVNQTGYLPGAPKVAAVAHDSAVPLGWTLLDRDGHPLATGRTRVFGKDAASGDFVHRADFSTFRRSGKGYVLEVGGLRSHPFRIARDLYAPLKRDALAYFYHNRSGIPIEARFVGGPKWARAAGHANPSSDRGGDRATCFGGKDARGNLWPGCRYTLNAGQGWYDAGDHGKYVVNGGLSVWTLMNLYETGRRVSKPGFFPDGSLRLPENANGVSDLLDEARWEMNFLLGMQVPQGSRLALPVGDQSAHSGSLNLSEVDASGMAHHKVHSEQWTDIPSRPDQDRQRRFLYPPSTAATLNLAASAAQCARVFRGVDDAYARRCLQAARRAWQAAERNPQVYAYDNFSGGGAYDDTDVRDEFYWAAAELYTTTGEGSYLSALKASPLYLKATKHGPENDLAWPEVTAAGTITLALVPSKLPAAAVRTARANIVALANTYVSQVAWTGYGVPFRSENYPWGSNSNVLNRGLVLSLASHFTGNVRYRDAALEGMNYVLGRNPLDKSYVSGYGARPLVNPHHRFWAHSRDPRFPAPPPGALAGGPNSSPADPTGNLLKGRCAPQTCYLDDIGTSSLNEVAINWNAPLAWVTTYLDATAQ